MLANKSYRGVYTDENLGCVVLMIKTAFWVSDKDIRQGIRQGEMIR